jgi:hypothetical protein
VTAFTPASGVVDTPVTITGTNFTGVTDVTFTGGVSVTPTGVTATSLHVLVPAGALTGPISVTNAAGTGVSASSFKVLPKITGFTPPSGVVGDQIVVSGHNLKTGSNNPLVKVGTMAAIVVSSSSTDVTFTIPVGAVTAKIGVTTADGTAVSATALIVTP